MTLLGSERAAVQNPFIRYAQDAGWTYLSRDEALRLRHGDTGLLLHGILIDQLTRLNPAVMNDARAGMHSGPWQDTRENRTPSTASRSRFGVSTPASPAHPIMSARC